MEKWHPRQRMHWFCTAKLCLVMPSLRVPCWEEVQMVNQPNKLKLQSVSTLTRIDGTG